MGSTIQFTIVLLGFTKPSTQMSQKQKKRVKEKAKKERPCVPLLTFKLSLKTVKCNTPSNSPPAIRPPKLPWFPLATTY